MKKALKYKDEKADKFWTIHSEGECYVVNYGKSGVIGRYEVKEFDSEEECTKQVEKQIKSKLKKGYNEDPDFDFDSRFYFDDIEVGVNPLTSHPQFTEHFKEDFYYDICDEEAPFGSDDGNDTLGRLEEYIRKNKDMDIVEFPKMYIEKEWGMKYYPPDHDLELKDSERQFVSVTDKVVIATCLGQIKIMGKVAGRLKDMAILSLKRLDQYMKDEGYGESYTIQPMIDALERFQAHSAHVPSEDCQTLMKYLDCPCEVFCGLFDDDDMIYAYEKALADGRKEGYTPLLVIVSDTLLEQVMTEVEEYGDEDDVEDDENSGINAEAVRAYRNEMIERAKAIDARSVLAALLEELTDDDEDKTTYTPDDIGGGEELSRFTSFWEYDTSLTKEVILAKVPVTDPWLLPIYIPMGGFNDCPTPVAQAAVMKRWYELYGAVPGIVSYETWEFHLDNPISDKEKALMLAYEHYAFCLDRLEQYEEDYTIAKLADSLMKSTVWYFWWD